MKGGAEPDEEDEYEPSLEEDPGDVWNVMDEGDGVLQRSFPATEEEVRKQ